MILETAKNNSYERKARLELIFQNTNHFPASPVRIADRLYSFAVTHQNLRRHRGPHEEEASFEAEARGRCTATSRPFSS